MGELDRLPKSPTQTRARAGVMRAQNGADRDLRDAKRERLHDQPWYKAMRRSVVFGLPAAIVVSNVVCDRPGKADVPVLGTVNRAWDGVYQIADEAVIDGSCKALNEVQYFQAAGSVRGWLAERKERVANAPAEPTSACDVQLPQTDPSPAEVPQALGPRPGRSEMVLSL